MKDVNDTLLDLQRALEMRKKKEAVDDGEFNVNKDIGDLIFTELQKMSSDKAREKRAALLRLDVVLRSHEN